MTRRQIGFVLDSFLLFLVALFIYALGRRSGKKHADETRVHIGMTPYPDGGILRRASGRVVGEFVPTVTGPAGYDFSHKTGGAEITTTELVDENVLRKGNEMWQDETLSGVGITISGSGRHVPGPDVPGLPHEELFDNKEKVTDRREEEEDDYYDERK